MKNIIAGIFALVSGNPFTIVNLAVELLKAVVAQTKNQTDDFVAAGIEAAVAELEKVTGSPVTKAQLEALRVEAKW